MSESGMTSEAFHLATLRSERTRVAVFLTVLAGLLVLVLVRGMMSLAGGHRGEAWPFAALLAAMTAYESWWLTLVNRAIYSRRTISRRIWIVNTAVECLLPTMAILLQIHTSFIGPGGASTSPVLLVYFLVIILSTLHLDSGLSVLSGTFSAAGYVAVCGYLFVLFPEAAAGQRLLVYGSAVSNSVLLLLGGCAAAAVASQIRLHVVSALREAENRAALEEDLRVARSIQQGLLPKTPPEIDGFDVAGWNQAADETGGDYFDWQQLPDGRFAVTIADVTGHGIGAALCMAACRSYARAGFAAGPDLRILLCRMNQLLHADLPASKFVTLAIGLLKPSEATLQLISAGHGPLLFYSAADDCFRTFDPQGIPLGLLPRATYHAPHLVRFGRGDILFLVTDGFVEWANANEEDFGEERLKQLIRTHRECSAAQIISELYAAVVRFAGPMPQLDDLTALVVKRV